MVDSNLLKQDPLFNLSKLEFFNLSLKSDNSYWDKFIEDMVGLRYFSFRLCSLHNNYDMMKYFLNLLEGNFL